MSSHCEMLSVADRSGTLFAHYHTPPVGDGQARVRGPVIDYIGPKYLQRWLDMGLVAEVGAEPEPQRQALPEPAKPAPSPRYRLTERSDAIWITDSDGSQYLHIRDRAVAEATPTARGPEIEWLSEQQASTFLLQGYVEVIGGAAPVQPEAAELAATVPAGLEWAAGVVDADGLPLGAVIAARGEDPVEPVENGDIVDECARSLDRLGVPDDAGAPTARAALREGGESYSNATIALAVRARKALAGTAS
jgi:cytochrome c oxidase cbb3-type subunit II